MSYGNPYSNEGFGEGLERGIGLAISMRKQEQAEKMQGLESQRLQQQYSQSEQAFPLEQQTRQAGLGLTQAQTAAAEQSTKHAAAMAPYQEQEAAMGTEKTRSEIALQKAQAAEAYAGVPYKQAEAGHLAAQTKYTSALADDAQDTLAMKQRARMLIQAQDTLTTHQEELKQNPYMLDDFKTLDAITNHSDTIPPEMLQTPEFHQTLIRGTNSLLQPNLNDMKGKPISFFDNPSDPNLHDIPIGSTVVGAKVANVHLHNENHTMAVEIDQTVQFPNGKTKEIKHYQPVPMDRVKAYVDSAGTLAHVLQDHPGGPDAAMNQIKSELGAISGSNPKYTTNGRSGIYNSLLQQFTTNDEPEKVQYLKYHQSITEPKDWQTIAAYEKDPTLMQKRLKQLDADYSNIPQQEKNQIHSTVLAHPDTDEQGNPVAAGGQDTVVDFSQLPSRKK